MKRNSLDDEIESKYIKKEVIFMKYFKMFFPVLFLLSCFVVPEGGGAAGDAGEGAQGGAAGGEGNDKPPAAKPPEDGAPPASGEDKTFTQAQLTAIINRKEQAAQAQIMKELGFDNPEAMRTFFAEAKKKADAEKTEAQLAAEQAAEANKKLEETTKVAEQKDLIIEALKLGVSPDKVDRAVRVAATYDGETATEKINAMLADLPDFGGGAGGQDFGNASSGSAGLTPEQVAEKAIEEKLGIKFD